MTKELNAKEYGRISPTAKITAHWRSLSDIPHSKEIAAAVGANETALEMLGSEMIRMGKTSPAMFEARYKSIDRGIMKSGIANVMELACGLSPRGIEIASKGGIYVGADLPDMLAESSPIIKAIAERAGAPMDRFHLLPANVLRKDQMEDAASRFGGKRFAVCNEGLLMYLDMDEKAKMAETVRSLLLPERGCWITTDIGLGETRKKIASMLGPAGKAIAKSAMNNIAEKTGRNISENDFRSSADALGFYKNIGFEVETFPMLEEGTELSTASLIPEKRRAEMLGILSSARVWILTPKT